MSCAGGLYSKSLPATLDAIEEKPTTPATANKKMSHIPDEVMHLLSIVDALEAILSLKRSGRAKHVLFRADKTAVEQAARRDFKASDLMLFSCAAPALQTCANILAPCRSHISNSSRLCLVMPLSFGGSAPRHPSVRTKARSA